MRVRVSAIWRRSPVQEFTTETRIRTLVARKRRLVALSLLRLETPSTYGNQIRTGMMMMLPHLLPLLLVYGGVMGLIEHPTNPISDQVIGAAIEVHRWHSTPRCSVVNRPTASLNIS